MKALIAAQGAVTTLPSRRVIIPALYDDPWSRDCAEAFGVRNNIECIAEFNGMTVAQVIETHTGCDYWVTGVGFVPGAFMSYAMEPAKRFGAPLYRTPRTWTHARLLNFGGLTSTIYPIRVPGGGQLFGRTPIEIFDPQRAAAPPSPTARSLARAGDRHRYEAIGSRGIRRDPRRGGGRDLRIPGRGRQLRLRDAMPSWLAGTGEPAEKRDPESSWEPA